MKTLLSFAAALGIAAASALPASAAIVNQTFQVTSPAQVVLGSGSYSFDDQTGVANIFGETEFTLTAFSFTFGAESFGLGDLDGGAGLVLFGPGNVRLGLEAYRSAPSVFSFLPAGPGSDGFLVYGAGANARTLDVGAAAVAVPVPGSMWLVAGLLPLAAVLRRRRG